LDTVLCPTFKIKIKHLKTWDGGQCPNKLFQNVMYHHQTTELYQILSMKIKELGKGKQTAIS